MGGKGDADDLRRLSRVVPEELIGPYTRLLESGGVAKGEAAGFLGGADVVAALTERGLAQVFPHTPTAPATVRAVRLDLALRALLAEFQAGAAGAVEKVLACIQLIGEFPDLVPAGGPELGDRVRIITDRDEVLRQSMNFVYRAQRDGMELSNADSEMPVTEEFQVKVPPALRGKLRCRTIYDEASFRHPVSALNIQRAVDEGEQARIVPFLPVKLKLADDTVALLALTLSGTDGAIVFDGGIPIVRMIRHYFELLWQTALPVGSLKPPPGCPLNEDEHAVAQLLSENIPVKAIASRLSLTERTVQRHVGSIKQRLNTNTLFAAGVAAERAGWVTPKGNANRGADGADG